jgi:hypothetical protein
MKTVLAKTPDMIKALQDSSVYPDSLDSGMQLLRTVNSKSPLLRPLEFLVQMEKALGENDQRGLEFLLLTIQQDVLNWYKNSMAGLIKKANEQVLDKLTVT